MITGTQHNQPIVEKTPRQISKLSLIIWISVFIVVGIFLWGRFTQSGQETLGDIANKGVGNWLFGDGDAKAEEEAAAELEKDQVNVFNEQGKVTSVNFSNCSKPSDVILKQISKLNSLSIANLANVKITDDQLVYFSKLNHLTSLVLNGAPISDTGLVHLVGLPSIQSLHLSCGKITDAGLESIVNLPSLLILDLSYTKVTDQGIKQITKLKNLNWLILKGNNITDAGIAELASISELKRLTLTTDMNISKEAIEQLHAAIPGITVDLADATVETTKKPDEAVPPSETADEKP